jgi:hypothetical protein
VTERAFQQAVIDAAKLLGWRCYHTHDSRRSAPGFPDIVAVRERVIFAELKTARGALSQEQVAWLDALKAAGQEIHVWREDRWAEVVETLRRKGA